MTSQAAALSRRFQLTAYKQGDLAADAVDWQSEELWLFTAERMVGLMRVEALADTEGQAVSAAFHFGGGGPFADEGGGEWSRHVARIRFLEHDYAATVKRLEGDWNTLRCTRVPNGSPQPPAGASRRRSPRQHASVR